MVEARVYCPGGFPDFTPAYNVNAEIDQVLVTAIMGYERPGQFYAAMNMFKDEERQKWTEFYTTSGYNDSWITVTLAVKNN